jgi:hypothetical protein
MPLKVGTFQPAFVAIEDISLSNPLEMSGVQGPSTMTTVRRET